MRKNKKLFIFLSAFFQIIALTGAVIFYRIKKPSNNQDIVNDYKTAFLTAFDTADKRTFNISQTSGTIDENKNHIIAAIKKAQGFPQLPAGVGIKLKPGQNTKITLKGVAFTLLIIKGSSKAEIATSQKQPLKVKRPLSSAEKAFEDLRKTFLSLQRK